MTGHAKLSPSKRSRWALCPGSIREEAKYPDEGSGPAAIDGTHSHTLLEHCVNLALSDPTKEIGQTFADHDGEFVIDKDRAERVKVAIDYIKSRVTVLDGAAYVLSESKVDPAFLLGRNDLSGTVDVQIVQIGWTEGAGVVEGSTLELIDYKDGMGIVSAKGNLQLEQYAYGVLAGYKLPVNDAYPFNTVRMTIIQPKLAMRGMNAISSHDVSVADLLANMGTIVKQAAATDQPDAPLVPGDSQCKFCRAKGSCAALASNVMKEVGIMFQPVVSNTLDIAQQSADREPSTMDDAQIAQIMEAAPLMRQLLEGVEKEALRRLKAGQSIAGLKLVNGRGSRTWSLTEEEIAIRLIKMGVPKGNVYETKLVSPAKAEKLTWEKTKAGEKVKMQLSDRQLKTMNTEYVTKLAGALTVAHESDERPAVIMNAAPLFSAVEAPVVETLPAWLM
jgi:hypothetical protein